MQQTIFCLWFDSQAEAEANIDVWLIRHSKLGNPPRGGEAGQKQGQKQGQQQGRQQPARDGQAHRLHSAVAA